MNTKTATKTTVRVIRATLHHGQTHEVTETPSFWDAEKVLPRDVIRALEGTLYGCDMADWDPDAQRLADDLNSGREVVYGWVRLEVVA